MKINVTLTPEEVKEAVSAYLRTKNLEMMDIEYKPIVKGKELLGIAAECNEREHIRTLGPEDYNDK